MTLLVVGTRVLEPNLLEIKFENSFLANLRRLTYLDDSLEKSDLASNVLAVNHRWRLDVIEDLAQDTLLNAIHMRPMTLGLVAFAGLNGCVLEILDVVAVVVKVVHVVVFVCQLIVVRVSEADFAFAEVVHPLLGAAAKKP